MGGDTNIDLDISELATELMETEVRTISNEECDASNGTLTDSLGSYDENYHQQITGNMLCAERAQGDRLVPGRLWGATRDQDRGRRA